MQSGTSFSMIAIIGVAVVIAAVIAVIVVSGRR